MRGHAPHDAAFAALLADSSVTTALLWPAPDALLPQELQQLAQERSGGRIALVAIDATWDGANRMRRKYPQGAWRHGRRAGVLRACMWCVA
jgi:DTW domain-containing protein YfiP